MPPSGEQRGPDCSEAGQLTALFKPKGPASRHSVTLEGASCAPPRRQGLHVTTPSASHPRDLAMAAELEALPVPRCPWRPQSGSAWVETVKSRRWPNPHCSKPKAESTPQRQRSPLPTTPEPCCNASVQGSASPAPSPTTRFWPPSQRTMRTRMIGDVAGAWGGHGAPAHDPPQAEDDDDVAPPTPPRLAGRAASLHTHTHTHTHIYIYIYIYTDALQALDREAELRNRVYAFLYTAHPASGGSCAGEKRLSWPGNGSTCSQGSRFRGAEAPHAGPRHHHAGRRGGRPKPPAEPLP